MKKAEKVRKLSRIKRWGLFCLFCWKIKQVEEIDYNNDGIIDDTIIVRRVFEVISVGSYIKMESAVYAEIEFFNNDGFVTTTINKWFTTK